MQEKVRKFLIDYGLGSDVCTRYLDLVSEIGEFGKEINKSTGYGVRPYCITKGAEEELGDCLFSLLALCEELNLDADKLLGRAINKYEDRFHKKGHIGSGEQI